MGWEEDYRQSQILAHTREMSETLKNIEMEQWRQSKQSSSSGGGGGFSLPSGRTMSKIFGFMVAFVVSFWGAVFVAMILSFVFMEFDSLVGCTFVPELPDYWVLSIAIAAVLGLTTFILLVRLVKRL